MMASKGRKITWVGGWGGGVSVRLQGQAFQWTNFFLIGLTFNRFYHLPLVSQVGETFNAKVPTVATMRGGVAILLSGHGGLSDGGETEPCSGTRRPCLLTFQCGYMCNMERAPCLVEYHLPFSPEVFNSGKVWV